MLPTTKPLLVTLGYPDEAGVRRLYASLNKFGGECASWRRLLVSPEGASTNESTIALALPVELAAFQFAAKVAACARAEEIALQEGHDLLIWSASDLLFVSPPHDLLLASSQSIALRPVHHKNIGLAAQSELDVFWREVYHAVDVKDPTDSVLTFIEQDVIRPYYNSHLFALRPELGLCREWWALFAELIRDPHTAEWCADELHRIFLHQALLSALICKRIPEAGRVLLPPSYSYPYNLHAQVPLTRRAASLDEVVCFTWETRDLHPDQVCDIELGASFREWLLQNW